MTFSYRLKHLRDEHNQGRAFNHRYRHKQKQARNYRSPTLGQFIADLIALLKNGHTWRRHHEPFSKTQRGRKRRQERKFAQETRHHGSPITDRPIEGAE